MRVKSSHITQRTRQAFVSMAYALLIQFAIALEAGEAGTVFSLGINSSGRTGLGTTNGVTLVPTPILTTNIADRSIQQIEAGGSHSLLLTDDGTVFAFGGSVAGQSGALADDVTVASPIDMSNLVDLRIAQVSAGLRHSLLVAEDGTVFSFGSNGRGQLGRVPVRNGLHRATHIDASHLAASAIHDVAGGAEHSLVLDAEGTVYSFGSNTFRELGRDPIDGDSFSFRVAMPIDASLLGGRRIVQVSAGDHHNLLLTDEGGVFAMGLNQYGQTGLNMKLGTTPIATPIDARHLDEKRIVQVAAGASHSLLLAEDGSVYSMGRDPQAGQGTFAASTAVATPINSTNLNGKSITQIAAGFQHSVLLADDGTVFLMGNGFRNDIIGQSTPTVATPIDLTSLGRRRVVDVAAGDFFTLLLTVPEPGGLFLWLVGVVLLAPSRWRR